MKERNLNNLSILPYDEAIVEDIHRGEVPQNKLGLIALYASAASEAISNTESATRRELEIVRAARSAGISWAEIGSWYGTTRQAAHDRWSRYITPEQ